MLMRETAQKSHGHNKKEQNRDKNMLRSPNVVSFALKCFPLPLEYKLNNKT